MLFLSSSPPQPNRSSGKFSSQSRQQGTFKRLNLRERLISPDMCPQGFRLQSKVRNPRHPRASQVAQDYTKSKGGKCMSFCFRFQRCSLAWNFSDDRKSSMQPKPSANDQHESTRPYGFHTHTQNVLRNAMHVHWIQMSKSAQLQKSFVISEHCPSTVRCIRHAKGMLPPPL